MLMNLVSEMLALIRLNQLKCLMVSQPWLSKPDLVWDFAEVVIRLTLMQFWLIYWRALLMFTGFAVGQCNACLSPSRVWYYVIRLHVIDTGYNKT